MGGKVCLDVSDPIDHFVIRELAEARASIWLLIAPVFERPRAHAHHLRGGLGINRDRTKLLLDCLLCLLHESPRHPPPVGGNGSRLLVSWDSGASLAYVTAWLLTSGGSLHSDLRAMPWLTRTCWRSCSSRLTRTPSSMPLSLLADHASTHPHCCQATFC